MKVLVYPGSFDPITVGHLDIIERSAKMTDKLIVTVMNNPDKNCFFSLKDRVEMIRRSVKDIKNVTVDDYQGLMVEYMHKTGASAAVRGLRALTDYEYELQWYTFNKKLDPEFEAVFMMAQPEHNFLSSSIVREIGRLGGDISKMVSPEIHSFVKDKLLNNR